MAFGWIQNIAIGASIDSADIVEIRDAADSVLDSLCVIDNVVENAGENGLDLVAEDGGANPAEDAGANPAEDAGANPAEDAGANPAEDAGANPAEDAGANPAEDDAALGANQAPDDNGEDGSDLAVDRTAALNQDDIAAVADNTDDQVAHNPTNVAAELSSDEGDHKTSV